MKANSWRAKTNRRGARLAAEVMHQVGVIALLLAMSHVAAAKPPLKDLPLRGLFETSAMTAATRHDIPFAIIDAVIGVESGYNPLARGAAGEIGLMQVMPSTAKLMGFSGNDVELANPIVNISVGTKYLARAWRLAKRDICTTVMKYRAGHGQTRFSQESVDYCRRVREHMKADGISVTDKLPAINYIEGPLFAASGPHHLMLDFVK